MRRAHGSWFAGVVTLALGCTTEPADNGGAQSDTPCQDIIMACHEKDDGTPGALNDCHQVGHDDNASACSAQLDECLQTCNDAPPIDDTDGEDHSEDHGETTSSNGTSTGEPPATDTGDTTGEDEGSSSSSTGNDSAADSNCADLGTNCHDVPGKVALMCHDVGHDGDEEACAKIWAECREACGF